MRLAFWGLFSMGMFPINLTCCIPVPSQEGLVCPLPKGAAVVCLIYEPAHKPPRDPPGGPGLLRQAIPGLQGTPWRALLGETLPLCPFGKERVLCQTEGGPFLLMATLDRASGCAPRGLALCLGKRHSTLPHFSLQSRTRTSP